MYIRVIQSVTNETNYSKLFLVRKNKKRMVSEKIFNDIDRFDRFFFLYKEKAKIILTRLPGKKRRVIIYLGVREI